MVVPAPGASTPTDPATPTPTPTWTPWPYWPYWPYWPNITSPLTGEVRAFGVEGTGAYGGARLARFLTGRGFTVVEVNRPDRSTRYRKVRATIGIAGAPGQGCSPSGPVDRTIAK